MSPSGRALGIDPGERRYGVAISDSARRVVTPLDAVDRRAVGEDGVFERVTEIVQAWGVTAVVVGLPRSLDGSTGPAAASALAWSARLREVLVARLGADAPAMETVDERFTTAEGARRLREAGTSGRQARSRVDSAAATVLLQHWIDARRGRPGGADPAH